MFLISSFLFLSSSAILVPDGVAAPPGIYRKEKTVMWYYETPIGVLKIIKTSYGYGFLFGDDPTDWTGHHDPRALADDVYCHATGCTE